MLYYLTDVAHGGIIQPFVSDDFCDRMAQTLDYFIEKLVGPQVCGGLDLGKRPCPGFRAESEKS